MVRHTRSWKKTSWKHVVHHRVPRTLMSLIHPGGQSKKSWTIFREVYMVTPSMKKATEMRSNVRTILMCLVNSLKPFTFVVDSYTKKKTSNFFLLRLTKTIFVTNRRNWLHWNYIRFTETLFLLVKIILNLNFRLMEKDWKFFFHLRVKYDVNVRCQISKQDTNLTRSGAQCCNNEMKR